jgi:ABC-2 type transport system ATP-binding protein
MMPSAIELEKLTKVFEKDGKKITAVNNVSLSIPQGSIFGLLGPNGAGKTTTIAMICTLLRPTKGKVLLQGVDVTKDLNAARRQLGLVFQETTLDKELSAYDNLRFQAMLYKLPDKEKRIKDALDLVGLKVGNEKVDTFSGGMKRRLEIARALISEPKIILLDEPTLGLDAASRRELWVYIKKLIDERHVTVLLTTHYLEEAERLSDYVAIMDNGKIVAQGTTQKLIAAVANDTITVTLKEEDKTLITKLRKHKIKVQAENNILKLSVKDASSALPTLLPIFGKNVARLEIKKPSLEDAYLHYTGKEFSEEDKKK